MFTFALSRGPASLVSSSTGTQHLFVVLYVAVGLPWLQRRGLYESERDAAETITRGVIAAILGILVGAYLVHCGALRPWHC